MRRSKPYMDETTDPPRSNAMTKKDAAKGRPAGSKNKERPQAAAIASQCPKCASSRRTAYLGDPIIRQIAGTLTDGTPYNQVTWRRTSCADCGQHRTDRTYENKPKKTARPKPPPTLSAPTADQPPAARPKKKTKKVKKKTKKTKKKK